MKGLPICFSEVQVKNDVTDNNNKHFVTAFEGECRNIIELREHLKLCFLIILPCFFIMIRFTWVFDCHLNIPGKFKPSNAEATFVQSIGTRGPHRYDSTVRVPIQRRKIMVSNHIKSSRYFFTGTMI